MIETWVPAVVPTLRSLSCKPLKAWWVFLGYVEVAFEGYASAGDRPFVEEPSDEGDAVGDSTRRAELRERLCWIGSPVAACLCDFNEAGSQSQRGMAGEVGDGEHLVAERGNQQQIDLLHDARH